LAEALAEIERVVAINPQCGLWPRQRRPDLGQLKQIFINLPRGWASSTAFFGQKLLYSLVRDEARSTGGRPVVLLTSPAYSPLAERLAGEFPIVSYTADDYRSYSGWGGNAVAEKERKIHSLASLSVFVSEALRERAIREFGLDPGRTFVSPNGTERRFAHRTNDGVLAEMHGRPGPVVGILGALTERLNLEALAKVASSNSVGTFLVAGPASEDLLKRYEIFRSDRFVVTGHIDHTRMHLYAQALDVAIIPYARSQMNWYCSPMRLYDHLATGVPIVALRGCDQLGRAAFPGLHVVDETELVPKVEALLKAGPTKLQPPPEDCFWDRRAKALRDAIAQIAPCADTAVTQCSSPKMRKS
jgi:glycosyltransferase involved in cell wall biosynthesis